MTRKRQDEAVDRRIRDYLDATPARSLTPSQARTLEIIRAAGGAIESRRFSWVEPGTARRISGIHRTSMVSLIRSGLLDAYDQSGAMVDRSSPLNVVPHRVELARKR